MIPACTIGLALRHDPAARRPYAGFRSSCPARPARPPWTPGSSAWTTSASRTSRIITGHAGRVLIGLHDPDGIKVRLYLPAKRKPEEADDFEPDGYLLTARDGPQLCVRRHPDERQGRRRRTGGAFTFSIKWSAPARFGPPLHVHGRKTRRSTSSTARSASNDRAKRFTAGPGDFTFLPRGIPHTFLVTRGPVRGLQITAPAGSRSTSRRQAAPRSGPACPSPGRTRHRAPGRRRAAPRQPRSSARAGPAVTVTRHRAGGAEFGAYRRIFACLAVGMPAAAREQICG